MWIDDPALKIGLCKMEQKYFSVLRNESICKVPQGSELWNKEPVD